jgi:5'-nucleotidase
MRILLVNDDGVGSPGLAALSEALAPDHEVWIVAPEAERSGSSQAITLKDSIRVRRVRERTFSCRGTPVDCVMVGLLGLVPEPADIVLSGINHGPNLGTDILYSGTASAARQAVLMGRCGVALSVGTYAPPFDFRTAGEFAVRNLGIFLERWSDDHFLNINFPIGDRGGGPTMITFPSRRIYRDEVHTYAAPNQDLFCFIGGPLPDARQEEGSDCDAVNRGFISITPVHVHPCSHAEVSERYRGVQFT